jgi:hypothetical protein
VSVGEWVVSGGLSWLGGSIGGGGWLVFGFLDFFVALFAILGVCIEERERELGIMRGDQVERR